MERISTGIKEVDNMVEGGFPKGSIIGINGLPGVGKSIFAIQFLLEGARNSEKGVYISLDEPIQNINRMIDSFSFSKEFRDFEKKGLIVIKCFDYLEYEKINLDLLEKISSDKKIKRVVFDSFNCFFDFFDKSSVKEDTNPRRLIHSSFNYLRRDDLNSLLILEKLEEGNNNVNYSIPYLVDGIINLDYSDLGHFERTVRVPKMRWTNQDKSIKKYFISSKGIGF